MVLITSGGDVEQAAIGGVTGAAFGAVSGNFNADLKCAASVEAYATVLVQKVVVHAAIGGLSSVAQGGEFAEGALSAGLSAAATPAVDTINWDGDGGWGVIARVSVSAVIGKIIGVKS